MTSLPELFLSRLQEIVPSEYWQAVNASFATETRPCFRVNTLKTTVQDVLKKLSELKIAVQAVEGLPAAFYIEPDKKSELSHHELAINGDIYFQDAGSQYIADLVGAKPGKEVLDLAAAPGGKTLAIASAMQNKGRLAAVEAVKNRFFILRENIERSGASIIESFLKDGAKVGRQTPDRFDKVLIDAPCSSESRFNVREPNSFQYWSLKKVRDMQRKQKQLLYSAILACKPGGKVIYSTCSFSPEENEMVVERQLKLWEEQLRIMEIELPITSYHDGLTQWQGKSLNPELSKAKRILPNEWLSGFFVCVLEKL